MRSMRKYQRKKPHPWLCRVLLLVTPVGLGFTIYALIQKDKNDSLYLGMVTIGFFLATWICHHHNRKVYRIRDIHQHDLSMELRRQKSK